MPARPPHRKNAAVLVMLPCCIQHAVLSDHLLLLNPVAEIARCTDQPADLRTASQHVQKVGISRLWCGRGQYFCRMPPYPGLPYCLDREVSRPSAGGVRRSPPPRTEEGGPKTARRATGPSTPCYSCWVSGSRRWSYVDGIDRQISCGAALRWMRLSAGWAVSGCGFAGVGRLSSQ